MIWRHRRSTNQRPKFFAPSLEFQPWQLPPALNAAHRAALLSRQSTSVDRRSAAAKCVAAIAVLRNAESRDKAEMTCPTVIATRSRSRRSWSPRRRLARTSPSIPATESASRSHVARRVAAAAVVVKPAPAQVPANRPAPAALLPVQVRRLVRLLQASTVPSMPSRPPRQYRSPQSPAPKNFLPASIRPTATWCWLSLRRKAGRSIPR